jgi:hypothetical protein
MDMKKPDSQPELQVIGKIEIAAAVRPLPHMDAPLTHDIVGDEGGLYSLHIEVQGLEYGIVHILLAFGGSICAKDILIYMSTHASPF